ncbi:hypothetical protein BD410DRAFT_832964 [Rickenella mellea]|uniref:Uncharacterized protein n=1 Tax=Rickenella mellea TaxID=50990 RepID=A0A4Y7PH09_9AGAM|nr:hypothetical protein BD410DRAFT_832964 [Rickenella mellea]
MWFQSNPCALGFTPKEQRNNLVAISPDILPLYQTKISDVDQLTSTYDSFVAQTVVPEESNLVYVRGAAVDPRSPVQANVNLFTVTNELVLWPQVLKGSSQLGTISLDYAPVPSPVLNQPGLTASAKSISLTPPGQGGRHDAIISAIGVTTFDDIPDAKNVADLLNTVDSNPALAFYNAIVADPVFDVYSFTTRLRFFDDSTKAIQVELDVESIGMPTGYDVSIFSDNPAVNMARTHIVSGHRVGTTISVKDGFDALITVQVYKGTGAPLPPNYASISVVASVIQTSGRIQTLQVIGAEHVLFDSAIRLSRGIVKARQLGDTAVGFYFRDAMGDTDKFPRTGAASHSPDIQPLGTVPDSNIESTLSASTYNIDVSDQKGVNIVSDTSNYVYLRGNTNQATHIETSLYAIPSALLIVPEMYGKHSIQDVDTFGNTTTAIREVIATDSGPLTIDTPFNWFQPPPPQSVDPSSDHYCLIAEARLWTADPLDRPLWPHQMGLPTGSDVTNWVLGTPTVAWRNVSWVHNPDAPTLSWQTNMTVPDGYASNTRWTLKLACLNMPLNGAIAMSATGPVDLHVDKTTITNPQMTIGVDFTGVDPFSSTVSISWWQEGGAPRPAGSSLTALLQINVGGADAIAQVTHLVAKRGPETENWPLVVGPHYPHLLDSKHHHGKKVKGEYLLGKAHPIQPVPHAGRFKHPNILARPQLAIALGADRKAVKPNALRKSKQ